MERLIKLLIKWLIKWLIDNQAVISCSFNALWPEILCEKMINTSSPGVIFPDKDLNSSAIYGSF